MFLLIIKKKYEKNKYIVFICFGNCFGVFKVWKYSFCKKKYFI